MVPSGWKKGLVSDLADTVMGYAFKSNDFVKEGIPLVRMGNLYQNQFQLDRSPIYLPDDFVIEYRKFLLQSGDLVMSMTGTMGKRDYGFAVEIPENTQDCLLNQRVLKIEPRNSDAKGFVLNVLKSEIFLSKLYSLPGGTKQANLSATQIREISVLIPPLPEQQKIANILSTWDKAISTTERLIENSTQQKKALMQQLLTGKKRLLDESGNRFEGEWEEVSLGDISKYQKGYTYKSSEYSEDKTSYGFLTLKSILRGGGYSASGIKYLLASVDEKFAVKSGDVVFAVTDLTRNAEVVGAPIFVPELEFEKAYISMDLIKLEIKPSVDKLFIYYLLQLASNRNFMRARASGSTVLHLDVKGSKKLKLRMPKLVIEQQKIAIVLTNADKEIELLEQQLADLQQEKKALMQVLLTGKKRVKT
ncbi:restriction endonuclease subunit S [Psychrobacter sp. UBA2769]|uniref:restriction endonuclease subunit S n=1 Tax=Psychrobacter sp. UBA2769 TaxID=1947348 RepID=UPI0025D09BD4|nr:restriction endonuclease subunit S [Psychrobacter sp. UBA2769]